MDFWIAGHFIHFNLLDSKYFEDNDYCYRIILSGLKCIRSQNSVFYHYGSQTQNSGERIVSHDEFDKNKEYYNDDICNRFKKYMNDNNNTHPSRQVTQSLRGYMQVISGSAFFMVYKAVSHLFNLSNQFLHSGLQASINISLGSYPL